MCVCVRERECVGGCVGVGVRLNAFRRLNWSCSFSSSSFSSSSWLCFSASDFLSCPVGKTVLAIDAVSDADLLHDVFPGGVFWLSVGKMTGGSDGGINSVMLLEKVQNFIARMDKERYRPLNLELATDHLQEVMTKQHPQSLLILDDIWEAETAKVFAVRCQTLVTTRYEGVTIKITNTPHTYPVSVMEVSKEDYMGDAGVCKYMCTKTHCWHLVSVLRISYCIASINSWFGK